MFKHQIKNLKIIRYEDLVLKPFTTVKTLMNEIGLSVTTQQIKYINLSLSNTKAFSYLARFSYGTFRDDPIKTAFKWKSNLKIEDILALQENCGDQVFEKFGYRKLEVNDSLEIADFNSIIGVVI